MKEESKMLNNLKKVCTFVGALVLVSISSQLIGWFIQTLVKIL